MTVEVTRLRDRLRVAMVDLRILEIRGQDVRDPASQTKVAKILGAMKAGLTNVLVTADGTFEDFENYEAMVQAMVDLGVASESIAEMMRKPEVRALSEHLVAGYWNSWVGAWVGWKLQPGAVEEGATQKREYLSLADGVAHLRMTETLDGEEFSRQHRGLVVVVDPDVVPSIEGSMVETFEAEVDPTTLRPLHTRYEMRKEYTTGGRTMTETMTRDDTFDWAHAEGCGD
jgi:hypothetical protein